MYGLVRPNPNLLGDSGEVPIFSNGVVGDSIPDV